MTEHEIDARLQAEWQEAVTAPPTLSALAIVDASAPEHSSHVALIAELEDVRMWTQELHDEIVRTGTSAARATTQWTVRDVIAHLASWAWQSRREVEIILAGADFDETIHFEPTGGPRAWNQREIDARASRDLAALVQEIDEEIERMIDLIVTLPEETLEAVTELPRTSGDPPAPWRLPLAATIAMTCRHARYHLVRLEPIVRGGRL